MPVLGMTSFRFSVVRFFSFLDHKFRRLGFLACTRSSYDSDIVTRAWGTSIDKAAVVGSAGLYGGSLTLWNMVQGALPQLVVPFTSSAPHPVGTVRLLVRGRDAPQDMDVVCLVSNQIGAAIRLPSIKNVSRHGFGIRV
jgi:hypothetical protein